MCENRQSKIAKSYRCQVVKLFGQSCSFVSELLSFASLLSKLSSPKLSFHLPSSKLPFLYMPIFTPAPLKEPKAPSR